jgi:uncharacterized protein (UPF0333 family)
MIRLNRRGQNTLEYVLLVTAVVGAFLAIQYYLNRGVQGRVRDASDNIGGQFDARATTNTYTTVRNSSATEINAAGVTSSTSTENTDRTGSETVQAAP